MDAIDALYYLMALISFVVVFRRVTCQERRQRLRPPGPRAVPLIGHLHLLKNPLHHTLAELGRQYGPVMSLRFGGRPVVVVSSPAAVEECFTKHDITLANRPPLIFGKHLGDDYHMLSWLPNGSRWRNLRRVVNVEFLAGGRLDHFSPSRAVESRSLVKELFRESGDGGGFREVNLREKFTRLVLNWMTEALAGKRYYGEEAAEWEEAEEFRKMTEEMETVALKPYFGDFFPLLKWFDLQGIDKEMGRVARKRYGFLQKLVDQRRQHGSVHGEEQRKTLLDALLALQRTDPEFYSDRTVRGIMELFLIVGTDTVYMTIEWAMALLLNHPNVMRKAREELDLQIGHERLIEESDLPKLLYLRNILYETLRLYPIAPLSAPHEPSEDCTIGGYTVPRGTMVMTNLWAIHTDPKLWEDPMSFKPERFDEMERANKVGLKWIPFGYGRRTCPGSGLALRELGVALGMLLQCFDWDIVGKEKVDMTEGGGIISHRAVPLTALYGARTVMINLLSGL